MRIKTEKRQTITTRRMDKTRRKMKRMTRKTMTIMMTMSQAPEVMPTEMVISTRNEQVPKKKTRKRRRRRRKRDATGKWMKLQCGTVSDFAGRSASGYESSLHDRRLRV